jgi:hypothetical protein
MSSACRRGWPGRNERGSPVNRAVAIGAVEFDRGARLGVQFSIAVRVLLEMAVDAVHSFFQMNVRQVDCLLEFVRVVAGYDFIFTVEQVALAVALVDGAENPAMAMEISELRLL